jgi:hypothetical protein
MDCGLTLTFLIRKAIDMRIKAAILALLAPALVRTALAAEGPVPKGISDLDHVFFIMMENHGYGQIFNNPNAPFINQLAKSANHATNYFAIGHPRPDRPCPAGTVRRDLALEQRRLCQFPGLRSHLGNPVHREAFRSPRAQYLPVAPGGGG